MNPVLRLAAEYRALARVLEPKDVASLAGATVSCAPAILKSKKLTALDFAMSRNMTVHFGKSELVVPIADIDQILRERNDSPTFGTVRELYARSCYLEHLPVSAPQRAVLDLGANRGMFTLLTLLALEAEIAVGVEPLPIYLAVHKLLLESNRIDPRRAPRYTKLASNRSEEKRNPDANVSIETIMSEQKIDRFNLMKIDIEGGEKSIFSEPEWLERVDNITMELHPHLVGDLTLIPRALERYGFDYMAMDQNGDRVETNSAMFLVASRTGLVPVRNGNSANR